MHGQDDCGVDAQQRLRQLEIESSSSGEGLLDSKQEKACLESRGDDGDGGRDGDAELEHP